MIGDADTNIHLHAKPGSRGKKSKNICLFLYLIKKKICHSYLGFSDLLSSVFVSAGLHRSTWQHELRKMIILPHLTSHQ